jgi:hypothetical protein
MATQLTFEPEQKKQGTLIFSLTIPGRLPSWNALMGQMEHWQRYKLKDDIQIDFLSALYRSANTSSMRTTSARNTILTAAATLESYRRTARKLRELKSAKKKLSRVPRRKSESKSIVSEPPPF